MTAIPNTMRRGAIYWYRRSRRLPCGNHCRPIVSLRTACPKAARRRAAILTAKFEDLYMRLFGNPGRRFALDPAAAKRIFQTEFEKALDAMNEESMQAGAYGYEYGNMGTFLDVHEEVYRYLAETNCSGDEVSAADWTARVPHLSTGVAMLAHQQLSRINAIWHLSLDETAEALEHEQIETDIFHMDHAMRLRFEARVAAVQEYRRRMSDPSRRFESLLAAPASQPAWSAGPAAGAQAAPAAPATPSVDPAWVALTAEQAAQKFISDNPKLVASETGKREAKWTDKTKSQFESAMRLLQKSMGSKPFVWLSNEDLRQLLKHFDGLPPNHHKSPRHGPMTLAEICAEAQAEITKGRLKKTDLGLNVPTLNRHFRFLKMAHEWVRKQNPTLQPLDWSAFAFEDGRSAREQREAFPVPVARKIFRLPPWHGCANKRHRLKPGRDVYHDSLYWVLPIIWYSGMRREEACKLQVTDIACSEDGIWYFDIDVTEAGRVKNASSRRWIPVADELRRLHFIDFVEAMRVSRQKLLFPELVSESRTMGETYYRLGWMKILACLEEKPDDLTLHGVRHTVADELKAAGVDHEVRADLLGHTLESETAGRYSKASRLNVLLEAVNKIPVVTARVRASSVCLALR
jgi:integrase